MDCTPRPSGGGPAWRRYNTEVAVLAGAVVIALLFVWAFAVRRTE